MKKVALLFFFLFFLSLTVKAQFKDRIIHHQNWDKQTVFWGYFLGLNKKDFVVRYNTNHAGAFIESKPRIGFNVGLIGDLRLHKNINLRLEPGLSSNGKELVFRHIKGGAKDSIRKVSSTYLRVPLLIKLNTNRLHNVRPYLIGGVSYDYNFSSNEKNHKDNYEGEFRMKTHNFSYEIGIGADFYLPYFIFSPSIRGVFAINNELVPDDTANSKYTQPIDYFGTRGIFIKFAFH